MPEIPMNTKIDRYHVPFIIFSPMLKRTASFASISTHFDVTPTLLGWLKNSYGLKVPLEASWMGSGIDTTRNFRNIHSYPLMQTKTNISDFISGNYILNENNLFKITPDMDLEPVNDPAMNNKITSAFNEFKKRNDQFINGGKLVPDSLISNFHLNKK